MLKYKVGDEIVLGKNVDVDIRKRFTPGKVCVVKQLCRENSSGEHYTIYVKGSDEYECWWVMDHEIDHEETAKVNFKLEQGTECQYSFNKKDFFKCEILFVGKENVVFIGYPCGMPEGVEMCSSLDEIAFRESQKEKTVQEKLLDKWKAQGLDFAHDTFNSSVHLKGVFDFIVNNYKLEDN